MLQNTAFEQRVRQVDHRIRELMGGANDVVLTAGPEDTATWDRGNYRATLTLHTAEKLPRLSLFLHTGTETHPDPVQIGLDDADVIELLAEPIAGLLSGTVVE